MGLVIVHAMSWGIVLLLRLITRILEIRGKKHFIENLRVALDLALPI
jgi:hypothetical protein